MKTIILEIPVSEIEDRVSLATSYTGARRETDGSLGSEYLRIATVSEDSLLLSRFMADAVSNAADTLKDFLTETLFDGRMVRLSVEVSEGAGDGLAVALKDTFVQYLSAAATGRWMRLACPQFAEEWEEEAAKRLLEISRALCHRRAPRRQAVVKC